MAAVADAAPGLASMLTSGEGFPDLSELLEHFRNAFDWAKAQKEGRVVPKPGTDDAHDAGLEAMKEAEASLEDERKKWAAELGDRTIEFWTPQVRAATATATATATCSTTATSTSPPPPPHLLLPRLQGNTSEPYQLCVSEATLGRTGVPEEFEMVSQKKGFKRFYTQEIKEIKDQYNEAKAQTEEALKQAANRLFARFSTHFPAVEARHLRRRRARLPDRAGEGVGGPGDVPPPPRRPARSLPQDQRRRQPVRRPLPRGRDAIPNDITIDPRRAPPTRRRRRRCFW